MKSVFANWRTTAGGVGLILGALADICAQAYSGSWDAARLMADYSAVVGGYGLIVAKDAARSVA